MKFFLITNCKLNHLAETIECVTVKVILKIRNVRLNGELCVMSTLTQMFASCSYIQISGVGHSDSYGRYERFDSLEIVLFVQHCIKLLMFLGFVLS